MSKLPAMFAAVARGDLEEVDRLVAGGHPVDEVLDAEDLSEDEKYGMVTGRSGQEYDHQQVGSPLSFAIASGQSEIALALLRHGASVRALQPDQVMPPLAVAVREGDVRLCRELLKRGASPNGGYDMAVLYEAASDGNELLVRILIEAGTDVNAEGSEFGDTALHGAVSSGVLDLVRYLCEQGANPKAVSEEGTPLDAANTAGHEDIVAFLRGLDA
jgi:ankyrin repeat protein